MILFKECTVRDGFVSELLDWMMEVPHVEQDMLQFSTMLYVQKRWMRKLLDNNIVQQLLNWRPWEMNQPSMPRLLQIDNRFRKIRTMPKINASGHTKSTPMEKWFTTNSIYISKVRSWHYESTSNILYAHQTVDIYFFGSNMLACQCFFVGQSVLYKKAEKAEKSVQPVVAVPRLGGSWHLGLEM